MDEALETNLLDEALETKQVVMVPVVLTELLSDPKLDSEVTRVLAGLPLIETGDGFWLRAGTLRSEVLRRCRRARLGDALIAQFCVDHDIPLISRDRDFGAFAESANLNVVVGPRKHRR